MPIFRTMVAYMRMLARQRRDRGDELAGESPHEPAVGRHRRRRHPRDDRCVPPREGGRPGGAVRARERPRRPRRLLRLRRSHGRPLLPRDPAQRRPGDRPRRGARARRPLPLPADEGRLLRRRSALLDDLAEGVPHLPDPAPLGAGAARGLRGALPAEVDLRRPRPGPAGGLASSALRPARARQALAPAARLEVRRALRRPSGDLHLGTFAPDVEDARQVRPGGHGLAPGRLPDADRCARAAHPLARRRGARLDLRRADRGHLGGRDRARRRGALSPVRPRAVHARAADGAPADGAGAGRARARRPLPLPRRGLHRSFVSHAASARTTT